MDSTLYWLWLAEALGSGYRLAGRLLEEYPDPAELYGQVKAGRNLPEYLSAKAREFMQAVAPAQMAGLKKRCDDLNIFILTPDSADYPQRLRDLPDRRWCCTAPETRLPERAAVCGHGGHPPPPQSMGFPPPGIFR